MNEPLPSNLREELHSALAGAVNYIRWRDKGALWCSPGFEDVDTVLADCDACLAALSQQPTLEPAPDLTAKLHELWQRVAQYGVECAGTKELAPRKAMADCFRECLRLSHPTERSASKPEAAIEDRADGRRICACCGGSGWED